MISSRQGEVSNLVPRLIYRDDQILGEGKRHDDGCNSCLGPLFHRNLGRLVLLCIDASDDESWRIFQHFSRSTRFAFFCTASNPGNFAKSRQNFIDFFVIFFANLHLFYSNSSFFVSIFMKISQDFTKFSEIFGNS